MKMYFSPSAAAFSAITQTDSASLCQEGRLVSAATGCCGRQRLHRCCLAGGETEGAIPPPKSQHHLHPKTVGGLHACVHAEPLQSCLTLCDPMDCSPPGSSVYGILQASILKWVAMPSSRGFSQPRDRTRISYVSCIGSQVPYH